MWYPQPIIRLGKLGCGGSKGTGKTGMISCGIPMLFIRQLYNEHHTDFLVIMKLCI
uniref:Uncharacterized protein n=1 Tax=Rhizophora mucronata TaxID=61149 RepID=A0A2P2PZ19_RHIMU